MSNRRFTSPSQLYCCLLVLLLQAGGCPILLRAQIQIPQLTIPSNPIENFNPPHRVNSDAVASPDFSITIRTDLLGRFAEQQSVKSDNVATRVLEADVRGVQTTTTSIQLETVESRATARFNILATGTVNSNTVGFTPQARVTTAGNHTFNVKKPIFFDGRVFMTKPAFGNLQANQVPQAVNTVATGMPLLGPIGDRIAWNEVLRRMPASDAIVVRRVADDVLPQINDGVDKQLVKLNQGWQQVRDTLRQTLAGESVSWSASTASSSLTIAGRNPAVQFDVSAHSKPLPAVLTGAEAVAIVLREEAINHWLAVQPIGGLTVSDASLQALVQSVQDAKDSPAEVLKKLQQIDGLSAEPMLFSIRLAERSPVAMSFDDGFVSLILQFQILPKVGVASQLQRMKIDLSGDSESNGMWSISVSDISVEPVDGNEVPDTWTTHISNQAAQLSRLIPPTTLPRTIDVRRFHEKLPPLRLSRIQSDDGWYRLALKVDETVDRTTNCIPWP